MTEEDKILINAYFDSELSADESTYIESLISSSKEANEYANSIKKANNEINSFFDNSEFKTLNENITKFKNELQTGKESIYKRFFNALFNSIKSSYVTGYAFTAIVFFSGGFFINFNENNSQISNSEVLTNININRGGKPDNDINEEIKKTIAKMLQDNSQQGRITYDDSSLIIFLNDKVIRKIEYTCYSANIFFSDSNQSDILYCASKNDSTITYIN